MQPNDNSSFVQLSQIHLMTNNAKNKLASPQDNCNGPNQNHYSQPLPIVHNGKSATTDRHIRLNQDHFNHNHYGSGKNHTMDPNYIHNNSHYSLPIDHDAPPPSPTPTPPPPALPMRNGSIGMIHSSNTTGRRSFSNNNNNIMNNNSLRHYH